MSELYGQGRIRAIGVSNFDRNLLASFCEKFEIKPAINQIEIHPFRQQRDMQKFMDTLGVATQSYSPFDSGSQRVLKNETLENIGAKYGKTAAQVALRWLAQRDIVVIPKTTRRERMIENLSIFDFILSDEDMGAIAALA